MGRGCPIKWSPGPPPDGGVTEFFGIAKYSPSAEIGGITTDGFRVMAAVVVFGIFQWYFAMFVSQKEDDTPFATGGDNARAARGAIVTIPTDPSR